MKPFLIEWINFGPWASNFVVQSIFRTFLHSIWEGILLAVVASLVVTRTRKSSAKLRYNIFASLLVAFLCAVTVTLIIQLESVNSEAVSNDGSALVHSSAAYALNHAAGRALTSGGSTSAYIRLTHIFNSFPHEWSPVLMSLWAIFFAFKCSRLVAGLYSIRQLRSTGTQSPGVKWVIRTGQLAESLGIRRAVTLFESRLAKVPMVLGFLKPIILVPMGMLAFLPADQVEAILLHELGHIRRNDYLVNLIQHMMEAIFFFNPAVLWLSALLRKERECCCDDLVLLREWDRRSYVDALVNFQEYQATFALPFNGNPLLVRIKRILSRENRPLNGAEKVLLVLGLLIVPAFGFMTNKELSFKRTTVATVAPVAKSAEQVSIDQGQGPADQQDTAIQHAFSSAGIEVQAPQESVVDNSAIDTRSTRNDTLPSKKDTIGGMAIPAGPMDFTHISRKDRIDADGSLTEFQAMDENGKHYEITKRDHQLVSLSIDGTAISEAQLNQYDELADFVPAVQGLKARNLPKDWLEEWLKYARLGVHFDHEQKRIYENMTSPDEDRKKINDLRIQYEAAIQRIMTEYRRKRRMANLMSDLSPTIVDIINDLRKEKLFATPTDTLLLLDQTGLYLDGKKQSDDVFAPLKMKYLHQPGDHYKYLDSAGTIQTWQ
ncbi:MAG TPA: M56 family metallopeptidase [Puia sp.]|nr:M56 family metallopeptidase [Puia sp.]